MGDNLIKINSKDDVAVAFKTIAKGSTVKIDDEKIKVQEEIPRDHKMALRDISEGEDILKYGHAIGRASQNINKGEKVHTHNVKTNLEGKLEYSYNPQATNKVITKADKLKYIPTFKGYM